MRNVGQCDDEMTVEVRYGEMPQLLYYSLFPLAPQERNPEGTEGMTFIVCNFFISKKFLILVRVTVDLKYIPGTLVTSVVVKTT